MSLPTRAEAIKRVLDAKTQPDLAAMYHPGMEVQVNVAQDDGTRDAKAAYSGKRRGRRYSDGAQTWYDLRIPKGSATDEPEDNSGWEMTYALDQHADGIGMTGWCFTQRRSIWVAFDFDSIVGHSEKHKKKLTDAELARVTELASKIPWVQVRRSASGNGLHLYVHFASPVPTKSHTEHAALGHAVLAEMSALVGYDFVASVDTCGGNMWVWHRKMPRGADGSQRTGPGLSLVKQHGHPMPEAPKGWERYLKVQRGERKKSLPDFAADREATFDETVGQQPHVALDEGHKKLIAWLQANQGWGWWDEGLRMLVTHTHHLKRAHGQLGMKGQFETSSPATQVEEQNCFCFPMRNGAWSVRRYSPGAAEHASWMQDGKGWTTCYFNREPDLRSAARGSGGVEMADGSFQFTDTDAVERVVKLLGGTLDAPDEAVKRPVLVKPHKDGRRVVVEVEAMQSDDGGKFLGWYKTKDRKRWAKVVDANSRLEQDNDVGGFDDVLRHCVTEARTDGGWFIKVGDAWNAEPKQNVALALGYLGKKKPEVESLMGAAVLRPWQFVNRPFEDEYPGDRMWNRSKVKFLHPPTDDQGDFPTWRRVLNHLGSGLDEALSTNGWALHNDVKTGGEYLTLWYASMAQHPDQPLPYLFFWSEPQDTGKSTFYEMAKFIFTEESVQDAGKLIDNKDNFNTQMEGTVLCFVEEINLQQNKTAYERIKHWVTALRISVRRLYVDPYMAPNYTHWVHCANKVTFCPIFPGDTRITVIEVPPIDPKEMIPKPDLHELLKREAPHFLNYIRNLEIPPSGSRLRVPMVATAQKDAVAASTRTTLEDFLDEHCHHVPGQTILHSDFMARFVEYVASIDPNEVPQWRSRGAVSNALPTRYPVGKIGADTHIGNISFTKAAPDAVALGKFFLEGRKLKQAPRPNAVPINGAAQACGAMHAGKLCVRLEKHPPPHVTAEGTEWGGP